MQGKASAASEAASASSADAREFLRERLGGFALGGAAFSALFLVFRAIAEIARGPTREVGYLAAMTIAPLAFVGLWLATRRARRARTLMAAELVALSIAAFGLALSTVQIPYFVRPDLILVMASGVILILRAIWVPTRARRTALLALVFGAATLAMSAYLHLRGHDPSIYTELARPELRRPGWGHVVPMVLADAVWMTAFAGVAIATTWVVHGLREEVRDARTLGQYTLTARLGAGGMGEVYRARHAMLRRPTAIKLLPPDKLGEGSLARFEREVQLTARLTHPNTIRIYDYGRTPDGVFYYAMELLDGADLARIVKETGPMPAGRVIRILRQAAGALAEAHGIGLIHRDIKPANILLTEQGGEPDVVKVVDFGLVKDVEAKAADGATLENTMAGTPQYMAPEAFTAPDRVDHRADLYALGAVGYFLLTGRHVFEGATVVEIAGHHLHTAPVPPSARGHAVPADLEGLLLACLAKAPAARPASARELATRLAACADVDGWRDEDARAFWVAHRSLLARGGARLAEGADDGHTALAIDLASRRAVAGDGERAREELAGAATIAAAPTAPAVRSA